MVLVPVLVTRPIATRSFVRALGAFFSVMVPVAVQTLPFLVFGCRHIVGVRIVASGSTR